MWRSDPERRGSDCSYGITVGSDTDAGAIALGTMSVRDRAKIREMQSLELIR